METGMQPKELGINYLVLYGNTKTQKVSSKSMTMSANLGWWLQRIAIKCFTTLKPNTLIFFLLKKACPRKVWLGY